MINNNLVKDITFNNTDINNILTNSTDVTNKGYNTSNFLNLLNSNINKSELKDNKLINRFKSDIFSNVREDEKFDIIVSNPPYIPRSEKINIQKEVTFDPDLALYTNDEKGLEFYEKISKDAPKYLNEQGHLAFEIGMGQSEDVKNILIKKIG